MRLNTRVTEQSPAFVVERWEVSTPCRARLFAARARVRPVPVHVPEAAPATVPLPAFRISSDWARHD
jgi:hypothetical protein